MNIHWLTIFGLILIAVGTFLTLLGQQKIFYKANQQLVTKSEKIEKLSEENIALNKEINLLNKKIAADLTGGDNYCYFLPSRPGIRSNIVDLMLMNEGEYPLYDISIKIDDVEKLFEIIDKEQEAGNLGFYDSMTQSNAMLLKASKIFQVGNLGPHQAIQLTGIQIPPNVDKKSYNIYITARNGSLMQILRYRRVGNQWKMAIKVTRENDVIKEFIDKDYPVDENGKINW
jgi:hypothetical protein